FPTQPMTVIGVAANVRRAQLSAPPKPEYYRPHSQVRWGSQYLVVQVEVDPSSVSSELRTTISSVDPTIPLGSIELVSQQVADSVAPERFRMLLLLVFAGLTCGLAMVGLYAVTTLAVSRRVGELGVRLALGANPSGLRRDVFGDAFRLVAVGVGLGVVLSVLATRLLATSIGPMLFETNASDVRVYAGVALFVFLVALIASVAPAQRASRVNPLVLLTRSSL
ncbi:MAG: FtsX-like permease family protein, partial [Gemmatimonadota bacterium]